MAAGPPVSPTCAGEPSTWCGPDREVLLSGGAVNSPQLLLLSGIGPAEHLREHSIDVAVHLPGVGENLHDHPAAGVIWDTKGTTDLTDYQTPARLLQWQIAGRGPLASNVGEAGGFMTTIDSLDAPDMQFHVAPTQFVDKRPARVNRPWLSPPPRRWWTWPAGGDCGCGRPIRVGTRDRPGLLRRPR